MNDIALPPIERFDLSPGTSISRLIKGGWQLAGGHGAIDADAAIADMAAYVAAGVTTFDCADIYTGVEAMIGAFRRRSGAAIRVHTKFVPDLALLPRITRADVVRLIDRSLQRLGTERLDLVQFHWWDYAQPRFVETALWLAELQRAGKIDQIGGTNWDCAHLSALLDAGVRIETMQVQYSVLDSRPAAAMAALCARHNIALLCYGTVAGGFLSERWLGAAAPDWPPENRSLAKYKLIIDDIGGWELFQALLGVLHRIARRHGVDIAAVAARHVLAQPQVAAVIVGVRNAAHLQSHRRLFGFELDAADTAELADILAQRRPLDGDVYTLERDREGRHGRIMKYDLGR